jgi:hypothetical protein
MKIIAVVFSIYLFASILMPSLQQRGSSEDNAISCCAELLNDGGNENSGNEDYDSCSECNPLACHCCILFFSTVQKMDIRPAVRVSHKEDNYLELLPDSIFFQIWQPPKVS